MLETSTTQSNVSCNGGSDGSIDLTVTGGTTPYTYAWTGTGVIAANQDQTGLAAGTYNVTVTDAEGCTSVESVTITEPTVLETSTTQSNVSCNGGSDGSIDLTVTGGTTPYTYAWTGTGVIAANQDQTGLAAGTYNVTVTDAEGCTSVESVTITEPAVLETSTTQSNVSCNGGSDGSIDLTVTGGTTPYTYAWTGTGVIAANQDQTGLAAGTYNVTVTDAEGCTSVESVTITEPAVLETSTTQSNVSCNGGSDGSIDLTVTGGTTPYTYAWTGTGVIAANQDQTGLAAGTYNVTVTDAEGCTSVESVTITEPAVLETSTTQSNVSCNGGSDGSIDLTVTGGTTPYTYAWTGTGVIAANQDQTGLAAGTYNVTVTDAEGCTSVESVTITEPAVLETSTTQSNVSCNGGSDGSIDLTVTGGTTPYTYAWTGTGVIAANQDQTGLAAGTYNVTVTDAEGCTSVESVTITEPAVLETSTTQSNVSCNGGSDGSIDLTVTGGTTPYTYAWTGTGVIAANQDQTGLAAGTYNVTVTDAEGCTSVESVTITEPAV